jgi:predicted PurR-regulated permease PerM
MSDISGFDVAGLIKMKEKLYVAVMQNEFLNDYLKTKITEYINTIFGEEFWIREAKNIFSGVGSLLQGVASSLTELALIVVFFFLLHWFKKEILFFVKSLLPMGDSEKETMAKEIVGAISVVFLTLVGIMLAQGVAFFVLMLFFDYNAPLLGFFTALSSVVPILGTAIVWVPVALSEFLKGNILNAVVISAYSWFVMAFLIDNFLRLFLLGKATELLRTDYKINEFLLFFSIAAGIAAFGFWGFIIGPSITALFLSSARSYKSINRK